MYSNSINKVYLDVINLIYNGKITKMHFMKLLCYVLMIYVYIYILYIYIYVAQLRNATPSLIKFQTPNTFLDIL